MVSYRRLAVCSAVLVTAIAVQLVLLSRLPLPGMAPNLVLVAVVALALTYGSLPGGLCGFLAGLALDVAPPADHVVGKSALVLCLVGYAAGAWWRRTPSSARSIPLAFVAVAVAALGSCALALAIAALIGEAPAGVPQMAWLLATETVYALVLAVAVIPAVVSRAHHRDPDVYLTRLR